MGEPPSKPSSPAIDPLVKVVKLPLVRSSFIAVKKGVTPMVGIGLIGAGRIAQIHAKAYTNVAGARLLAVADIFPEAAKRTSNTFRLGAHYDNHDLVCRDANGGVIIAGPHPF